MDIKEACKILKLSYLRQSHGELINEVKEEKMEAK